MGGGGMFRAVGRVSGIAVSSGLRGATTVPAAEHPALGVSRKAGSISTSLSGKISSGITQASEVDDWVLAGDEGDFVMSSSEPLPRVVFGAVPTFQEAKEATDELKDALEKVYLSSPAAVESGDSLPMVDSENKYIVATDQSAISPPAPKHAVQAFKLLTHNAAAQNVVASIASDPNVWNAVLHNEALMGFLQSEKAAAAAAAVVEFPSEELTVRTVEDAMSQNLEFTNESSSSDAASGKTENGFMKVLKDIKYAVEQMVSNLSCFLHNIFNPNMYEKSEAHEEGVNGGSTNLGVSFFGLAVLAIIVVLLKRPY